MPDPARLTAGYRYLRGRGAAFYEGVLRDGEREAWRCGDEHLNTVKAVYCAAAELDRRRQGTREVFELLRCAGCRMWHEPDGAGGDWSGRGCPACGVPLSRVKVIIVESAPA